MTNIEQTREKKFGEARSIVSNTVLILIKITAGNLSGSISVL